MYQYNALNGEKLSELWRSASVLKSQASNYQLCRTSPVIRRGHSTKERTSMCQPGHDACRRDEPTRPRGTLQAFALRDGERLLLTYGQGALRWRENNQRPRARLPPLSNVSPNLRPSTRPNSTENRRARDQVSYPKLCITLTNKARRSRSQVNGLFHRLPLQGRKVNRSKQSFWSHDNRAQSRLSTALQQQGTRVPLYDRDHESFPW